MLTLRGVNGDLADTAVALTAILAAHPEQLERHVAAREQGRHPWQTDVRMDSIELTSVLVAELQALIGSTLHALRTNVIMEPTERLSAYEAIDLASRRAAGASELAAPTRVRRGSCC
jgi:hypothetical protein